jgi:small basic protein
VIPLIGLAIGVGLGLAVGGSVPPFLAAYLPVAVITAIDALVGGLRARLEGTFSERVFLAAFLGDVALAVLLVYLGEQLGVGSEATTAVIVALGVRMFQNLTAVRRQLVRV